MAQKLDGTDIFITIVMIFMFFYILKNKSLKKDSQNSFI